MRVIFLLLIAIFLPLKAYESAQPLIDATPVGGTLSLSGTYICNCVVSKSITISGGIILSPNADPALYIPAKTHDVILRGVEFSTTTATQPIYDLVRVGEWAQTVLADVPTNITFDSVYVHALPTQEVQRGIAMNGANVTVKNSRVLEIHGKGYDTQALAAWNGPGPFTITDNILEASGEVVMFGGADAHIQNLVPGDIQIRRNRIRKPLEWRGVWTAKNLLELKNARRVVIDGNVLENSWGDAQIGFGVLFTVRNQNGTNPWAILEDIQFTNNTMTNVAGGFQLQGVDNLNSSQRSSRLTITNNVITLAQAGALGPNGRLLQLQEFDNLTFSNNEANPDHTHLNLTGKNADGTPKLSSALIYQNNLVSYGQYGVFGDEGKPYTYYAPDGKIIGNYVWGTTYNQLPGNTYLATKPISVPVGVGVDYVALQAAQGGAAPTPSPTPTPTPSPTPSPTPVPTPTPIPTPTPTPTPAPVPCSVTAPVSVLVPRRSSRGVSITLDGLTGSVTVTTLVSSGQVSVNPASKSVTGTSAILAFVVGVKQNSGNVKFMTPCGDRTVQVIAQ